MTCSTCGWGVTPEMGCPNPDCDQPGYKAHMQQPEPPRRKRKLVVAVAGFAGLLLLAGLAGASWFGYERYQDHKAEIAAAAAKKKEAREEQRREAKRVAAIERCQKQIGDYVDALVTLDARLNVGMNSDEFTKMAGDASVEESRVSTSELNANCTAAKEEADQALSYYSSTAMEWDDCIYDFYCDIDEDLNLELDWLLAADHVAEAEALMNGRGGEIT